MTKLILEWRAAHPGVCVTPYESGDRSLHAALTDCQIDAALVPDFLLHNYGTGSLVYSEPLMAVVPTSHRLASQRDLRWRHLQTEILLLWAAGKGEACREFFAARLPCTSLRVFEADSLTVLAFVRIGYCITISAGAYSTLNLYGLVFVPIVEENAHVDVSLTWRPESEDPVMGKFVAFIRDRTELYRRTPPSSVAFGNPDPSP
ncbi:LysR family substrate-binding domain-containing protein [Gluconacetobacter sacchari]|uniref:LysR family substrate-binding domain-containing protein n=1 Tax=Gluconacetobacter sacchari TaxID=92759 RepID=UPI0039B45EC1